MKKKNNKKTQIDKAIAKALFSLGGMLDIPTAKAIRHFFLKKSTETK